MRDIVTRRIALDEYRPDRQDGCLSTNVYLKRERERWILRCRRRSRQQREVRILRIVFFFFSNSCCCCCPIRPLNIRREREISISSSCRPKGVCLSATNSNPLWKEPVGTGAHESDRLRHPISYVRAADRTGQTSKRNGK